MKKLIANICRLIYTKLTRETLPAVEESPKATEEINHDGFWKDLDKEKETLKKNPKYKVAYDEQFRDWRAYKKTILGWEYIPNTFMATAEGAEQRLQSYIKEIENLEPTRYYGYE